MKRLADFIKNTCSQELIQELVKELSVKEETKKTDVPRTWEEYDGTLTEGYIINASFNINKVCCFELDADKNKNVLPTREMAESFLAMMQLMSLRKAWVKDWEPCWEDVDTPKYCIFFVQNKFVIFNNCTAARTLSFPSKKMAEDFMECFISLIEQAKVLI